MSSTRGLFKKYLSRRPSSAPPGDIEMVGGPADDGLAENQPEEPLGGSSTDDIETDLNDTMETQEDTTTATSPLRLGVSTSTMQGRRSAILENMELHPEPAIMQELIRKSKAPLQSFLIFDYTLLMGFFRLNQAAEIVSSCWRKIFMGTFVFMAMVEILLSLNLTSFYINDEDGNKIKRFTEMMLIVSIASSRIAYVIAIWCNRSVFSSIFITMQGPHFVQAFFNPQRWDWVIILRCISYVSAITICFTGMDTYRVDTLKEFGWSYADLLDIHESNILNSVGVLRWWAFASGQYYNQAQLFNQTMQASTFVLGHAGIVIATAGLQLDSAIRDFFLTCIITLLLAVMILQMSLILKEDWDLWLPEEIRRRFRHIFQTYKRILQLASDINKILRWFLPFMISTDVLNLVMTAFYIIDGNWTFVITLSFNLLKSFVGFGLVLLINSQISKIEEWFIADKTQEILNFPTNKYMATLFEFTRFPIGIGTAATYICEGFIVTFLNCALTYFFLVAQAVEGDKGIEALVAVANKTV